MEERARTAKELPEMPRRPTCWLALTALLVAAGCREAAAETPSQKRDDPIVSVPTEAVAERLVPQYLTVTGSLAARQKADVAADASGRVVAISVERGAYVAKGATLAILDASKLLLSSDAAQAQAKAAEVEREAADADCTRAERLFQGDAISVAERDRLVARCRVTQLASTAAKAQARLAGRLASDSTVRAPFAGLVAERFVSPGEYVRPDTRVVTILDIDTLRLELTIPEAAAPQVHESQKVKFRVQSFPERTFEATIKYIGPALRRSSRDLVVEALLDNANRELRPGMFATARVELGSAKVKAVPVSAIKREGGTKFIFVATRGRIEQRVVLATEERDGMVVVEKGVQDGEMVVAQISDQVRDGARMQ